MNEYAFVSVMQTRPCPTFGRPVHLRGSPHRLRPGSSPHAFRIPSRDGHPALRRINFILQPARHYPRFWIWPSSSECQKDFNLPEQRAAQHTLHPLLTSALRSDCLSALSVAEATQGRSPGVIPAAFCTQSPNLRVASLMEYGLRGTLPARPTLTPCIRFLFIDSHICLTLPSDLTSRR